MNNWRWSRWSIAQKMWLSAFLQLATIVSVVLWSYSSRIEDIYQDMSERGSLISESLAQSSVYGVISGNTSYVEQSMAALLKSNKSILRIQVVGTKGSSVHIDMGNKEGTAYSQKYVSPIVMNAPAVNAFDLEGASTPDTITAPSTHAAIGTVIVYMSAQAQMDEKQSKLLGGTLIGCAFVLLSVVLGFAIVRSITRPLLDTIQAIRKVKAENYDVAFKVQAGQEIEELQATIISMTTSLRQYQQNLEQKVELRTKALAEARDEAVKAGAERRRLIQQVNSAAEAERQTIAVEIHDHLNALLIVARLEANRILSIANKQAQSLINEPNANPAELRTAQDVKARTETILKTIAELYKMARDIVKRLRPEVIDTLGLRAAVDEMVRYYDQGHPTCDFEFESEDELPSLPGDMAISVYRLVQEALSNVVKHAEATSVHVSLKYVEASNALVIEVMDNGKGFDIATVQAGIGLIGMRERVQGLNGTMNLASTKNKGTSLQVQLPIADPA